MNVKANNLAVVLEAYMRLHGIKQKELAFGMGITESTLTRILHGEAMSLPTFMKVFNWFSCTTDSIL